MISADSLVQLVQLKESGDDPDTAKKIRSLLTRLDHVIDVVFTTAKDVESATVSEIEEDDDDQDVTAPLTKSKGNWAFTDSNLLQAKREEIVASFGRDKGTVFVKSTRALYWDSVHQKRLTCTMSKRYTKGSYPYWYAFHPQWDDFLAHGSESYIILGCMDLSFAFAIPWKVLHDRLDALNTTTTKDAHKYWHLHLVGTNGEYAVHLPKTSATLPLDDYKVQLGT